MMMMMVPEGILRLSVPPFPSQLRRANGCLFPCVAPSNRAVWKVPVRLILESEVIQPHRRICKPTPFERAALAVQAG